MPSGPVLSDVRQNVAAGLVVGIVALPLSIALAVAVGVSPVTGLYTASFAGLAAAVFGGSRYNITGPTAALVPILSRVVLQYGPQALPTLAAMAGALLLMLSVLRAGRLMRFMPGLVVTGFTAGIALSIGFGQLNSFLAVDGTDPALEHFHERFWDTLTHLGTISATTPLIGLAAVAVMLMWPRVPRAKRIPAPLVAVACGTALVWWIGLDTPTIQSRYGDFPTGLPMPSLNVFDLALVVPLLPVAITVAVLGAVESLLSAVVADGMASVEHRHNPDRELFGQGIANLVSPIMGGMPATAAIARTATGIRNGATSWLTGAVHACTVLVATVVLGPWAGHIPLAVLAAVLLIVAWNIAEVPAVVRLLRRAPREDLLVLVSTALITLFLDLTYAIGFGIIVSALLLIRRLVRLPAAQALLPDETGRITQVSEGLSELIQSRPDVTVFTVQGLLSFHSAAALEYELGGARDETLILRMKGVQHIDTTGLLTLEGVIEHRLRGGRRTILTALDPSMSLILQRFGIIDLIGHENVFAATRDAIASVPPPGNERRTTTSSPHAHASAPHTS